MKLYIFILNFLYIAQLYPSSLLDSRIEQDRISRKKLEIIAKNISKNFHFTLLRGDGISSLVDNDDEIIWCSKYMVQGHAFTIEEFRPVMQNALKFFWQNVKKEPSFSKYLYYKGLYKRREILLSPIYIGMRVDFWAENNNRYFFPYLSQVVFKNGKIHYYYADPVTLALQKPGIIEDLPDWITKEETP